MKKFVLFLILNFIALTFMQCDENNDFVVIIHTEFGDMHVLLYDETPEHKKNFLKLAHEKFYDSTAFHRVIKNFMIQGGDPNSKPNGNASAIGTGGTSYTLPAEFVPHLKHVKGALAAARQGDFVNPQKRSSGSQFYIVHSEQGTSHLNGDYTVFGLVVKGLEVIDKVATEPTGSANRPKKDIRITMTIKEMKRKEITKEYGFQYPEKKEDKKSS